MLDTLDEIDLMILDLVQIDCQVKTETIIGILGLPKAAIVQRLKRLRDDRVILAEIAVVHRKHAGTPLTIIVSIEIDCEDSDAIAKFGAWAEAQQHIQQVYHVTGQADIIAIVVTRDVSQLDQLVTRLKLENPQIKRVQTNIVLREIKVGMYLPIQNNSSRCSNRDEVGKHNWLPSYR